ncbi:MAG: hypothetical protein IJM80_07830 [Firmicutes bacterium]|nr:hypothetical protein [Bacillota bacterium]
MSERKMKVLSPRGLYNDIIQAPLSQRPKDYNGKTIYIIDSWPKNSGFGDLVEAVQQYFREKYPTVNFLRTFRNLYSSDDPKLWKEVKEKADAFIYVGAPSCSTTAYAMTWPARALERYGLPGVVLIYTYLEEDAKMSQDREGMNIRYVDVPYPLSQINETETAAILKRVEAALTEEPKASEIITGVKTPAQPERIAFEGTEKEIRKYFYDQGWTDGLPIVLPTEENVAEMLKGTSHAPDEVVCTQMAPEGRVVTVERAAVNAVMAGAEPSFFPVILASYEIMGRTQRYHATSKSTNSFSYMQIVNGPVRDEIGMNSGVFALGPGNQANATIGRALRLGLTNLGGATVGVNLMGVQGNVSSYTFCFAENEEASPWNSLAEELGYSKDESVVTVFTGGFSHCGNYMLNEGLDAVFRGIKAFESPSGWVLIISPRRAEELAAEGYDTKEKIMDHLWHMGSMSIGDLKRFGHFDRYIARSIKGDWGKFPKEYLDLPDDAVVPMFPRGEINIAVAGDPQGTNVMQAWMSHGADACSVDKWR